MKHFDLALILVGLFLVGTTAVGVAPPAVTNPRGYEVLGQDLEPFRSDFNAKVDHVRAVLLVGPT